MKINDIRPNNLSRQLKILQKKDISNILKSQDQFIYTKCPACGSNQYKKEFVKVGFVFVRCKMCDTLFVNPRPNLTSLDNYYKKSKHIDFWNSKIYPQTEMSRRKKIFRPRVKKLIELCIKYHIAKNLLVDIGAGFGTFCEELQKQNFFKEILAVEPSRSLAKTCKKKGIKTVIRVFENTNISNIDVITCFELIEHLFSPLFLIKKCYKNLKKRGLLVITTPNIDGFDLKILGKKSDNILAPNHLNYFNPYSLRFLLEKVGFEILEITTPGKLDAEIVRQKILEKEYDAKNNQYLKYILIEKWTNAGNQFQKFLESANLSSHMWCLAKKP